MCTIVRAQINDVQYMFGSEGIYLSIDYTILRGVTPVHLPQATFVFRCSSHSDHVQRRRTEEVTEQLQRCPFQSSVSIQNGSVSAVWPLRKGAPCIHSAGDSTGTGRPCFPPSRQPVEGSGASAPQRCRKAFGSDLRLKPQQMSGGQEASLPAPPG